MLWIHCLIHMCVCKVHTESLAKWYKINPQFLNIIEFHGNMTQRSIKFPLKPICSQISCFHIISNLFVKWSPKRKTQGQIKLRPSGTLFYLEISGQMFRSFCWGKKQLWRIKFPAQQFLLHPLKLECRVIINRPLGFFGYT